VNGGTSSGGSATDTGFALDTEPLVWYDGGTLCAVAGTDRWYVTMLQRGFTYSFDFAGGTGALEFYTFGTLDMVHEEALPAGIQSWKCDENGASHKFYIRVLPGSPGSSFTATYGY
jgi:hypothetical protein